MSDKNSKCRLDLAVRNRHQLSWNQAREWIRTGKIWIDGVAVTEESRLVAPDVEFELKMNAPRSGGKRLRAAAASLKPEDVILLDTQLIVLNKAAGISTVPFDESENNSLEQRTSRYLKSGHMVVVHRLDRDTTGLLVFARTPNAGKILADQFRAHTVLRRYFALAHGQVKSQTIRSLLVENRGDGLRGSHSPHSAASKADAKPAVTHVTALLQLEGMTLVECRLETGRTHQIRIHLGEAGHPLLGEKTYNRYYTGPKIEAPRMMLHAAELGFTHPTQNIPLRWTLLPPADFLGMIGARGHDVLAERLCATRS
ncbi:MAG: RluA family pseudouridine synthase [Deltaproteobacteria bacterium]|nr:RluA family pseudouridine synthase [Deltaproteobacteria bacterium]